MPNRDKIPRRPRHTGIWYQIIALVLHACAFIPGAGADPARTQYIYHNSGVAAFISMLLAAILLRGLFGDSIRVKCRQKALVGCFCWWAYQLTMSVEYDGFWHYDAALATFCVMACVTLWLDVNRKPRYSFA